MNNNIGEKGPGIDYSLGTANRDKNNHEFHFGAIPIHNCSEAWYDSSELIYPCYDCEYNGSDNENGECDCCEAIGAKLEDNEYFAISGEVDIIIERSPYYTLCSYASPCFSGGGYILAQNKQGIKTYCLGIDFYNCFEPLPIDIYEVKTGKLIAKKGQAIE